MKMDTNRFSLQA